MAAIALDDEVELHGGIIGTVVEVISTEIQNYVMISYSIGKDIQTTTRETKNLVEVEPNKFKQQGASF